MAIVRMPMEADQFMKTVCEAIGVDHTMARRVIVDGQAGEPIKVYVERFADKAVLDLDWKEGLAGAQIKVLNK